MKEEFTFVQNEKEISVKKIMEKVHRTEFLRGSKLETRAGCWTC